MTLPLTIDRLLWRMENVHLAAEVVEVVGSGSKQYTQSVSFSETAVRARALAAGLADAFNVGRGSVVTVMAFNTRAHFELLFAGPSMGAVVESLNVRMSADVLTEQLVKSRPAVVAVDEEVLKHPVVGSVVRAVLDAVAQLKIPVLEVGGSAGSDYERLVAAGRLSTTAVPTVSENDVAYLFHTSGTTGPPKTYSVTHRDVVLHALCQAASGASGLGAEDRVLPLAPFFHVNGWGLPFTCAITGADVVLMGGDMAADRVVDVLLSQGVTVAAAVPTVWYDVCQVVSQDPTRRPPGLREVLSGGSAVPMTVVASVMEHLGANVATAWGMTETMACSTYERNDPSVAAGVPIPLVETRVVDMSGPADRGSRGRLEVRGPFVIGAPAESEGWMDTGDIASLDERGRLLLHDRQKDLIKSGGEWIASAELEQRLCTHPDVLVAAVVARPDPRWIERPVAYVKLREGVPLDHVSTDLLRAHLAETFPNWWLPDTITITDDLPMTAVGKIDKAALRRAQVKNPINNSEEVLT